MRYPEMARTTSELRTSENNVQTTLFLSFRFILLLFLI